MASSGCLLLDVRPGGRFEWAEALPVLEALAEELEAACADGTLPHLLSLEQVWIGAAGRVQLLDLPLRSPAMVHEHPEPQRRALDLLRQVAARTLEGQPRAPDDTGPIRAPLPDRAAAVLHRLMAPDGNEPVRSFATVRAVGAALRSAREAPVEVTRRRRAIHLLTLAPLVVVGILWLLGACYGLTMAAYTANWEAATSAEKALDLAREANADLETQNRLNTKTHRLQQRREHLLDSHLSLVQPLLADAANSLGEPAAVLRADDPPAPPRERIRRLEAVVDEELDRKGDFLEVWMMLLLLPLLVVSVIWPLWAGATRGGGGQWLAGVRLVQTDGRHAARWRCAWRAILVCLPIAALLGVSLGIEGWRLAGEVHGVAWAWLVWLTWWLGLAMIPLFAWLALRSPNRGLHDRLAGTYLVPR